MANIKSQKKRILTNEKSRQRNVAVKSRVKTFMQKAETALEGKDPAAIKEAILNAVTELDRAASKGIIHPNSVARKKSSLARRANAAASA